MTTTTPVGLPTPPRRRTGARPKPAHYLMVLPMVALFTLFIVVPAVQGAFFSFTSYAGYGEWHGIGFANYRAMLQDPNVLHAYGFTFTYAAVATVLVNVIAVALAILLNSRIRWPQLWRGIYFIPMVLSGLVVSYCFQYLFNQSLPLLLRFPPFNNDGASLLALDDLAWLGVVFVGVWTSVPGATIIYLAGLASIGHEVYEASEIDGASPAAQLKWITLPLLFPFVIINTVLGLKGMLNVYDLVIGLTGGGPAGATTPIAKSIIDSLGNSDYAYGVANAMVFFVVTVVLSVLQLWLVRVLGRNS